MSQLPPPEQPADTFGGPASTGGLLLRGLVVVVALAVVAVVVWYNTR